MISLHKLPDLSSILDLKAAYLLSLVAPMDGMWELGFINPSPHWEIRWGGQRAGYYAANDEGALLQLYVLPAFEKHGQSLLDHVVAQATLTRAVASTIDPTFLSLCLDMQKPITVHTYLYEIQAEIPPNKQPVTGAVDLRLIEATELDRIISLQQDCIGGDEDLSGWLRSYSGNLIEREELFVLCRRDEWLGTGEYRRSDSQKGVVDLGMMVVPAHRGEGWATYILSDLGTRSKADGLRAICSTTVGNVGAQKAIMRSGFISRHRIMNVSL